MIPNPNHRWRDDSTRSPSTHHPSLYYGSCFSSVGSTGHMHSHIALRNIWLGFVALPWRSASAIDACASFGRFASAFDAMQYTRDTSTASVAPFRGSIFFVLDCASCPSSSSVLARYHLFRCVAFGANAQIGGISLFPFFWFFALRGVLPQVLIQSFMPLIQNRRFTTRHLLCWLRHQRAFRAVSAFSFYHGLRLSALFFSAASFHPRLQTVAVSINQVRSPHPTKSPSICFYGFLLDFGFAQGEIYIGSGYLILYLWLYLWFFKNAGYMEKGY